MTYNLCLIKGADQNVIETIDHYRFITIGLQSLLFNFDFLHSIKQVPESSLSLTSTFSQDGIVQWRIPLTKVSDSSDPEALTLKHRLCHNVPVY